VGGNAEQHQAIAGTIDAVHEIMIRRTDWDVPLLKRSGSGDVREKNRILYWKKGSCGSSIREDESTAWPWKRMVLEISRALRGVTGPLEGAGIRGKPRHRRSTAEAARGKGGGVWFFVIVIAEIKIVHSPNLSKSDSNKKR